MDRVERVFDVLCAIVAHTIEPITRCEFLLRSARFARFDCCVFEVVLNKTELRSKKRQRLAPSSARTYHVGSSGIKLGGFHKLDVPLSRFGRICLDAKILRAICGFDVVIVLAGPVKQAVVLVACAHRANALSLARSTCSGHREIRYFQVCRGSITKQPPCSSWSKFEMETAIRAHDTNT